jgi:tripartite-type tricarboxylate transporter receptor subunit TctC
MTPGISSMWESEEEIGKTTPGGAAVDVVRYLGALCRACALGWLFSVIAFAASANEREFFSGRQITLLCGSGVGGGYDTLARVTARHLGRLIPGNPSVVVQNMPAAASIAAANRIYSTAPRDGTVLALVQRNLLTAKLFNPSAVRFDLAKFNWIGSLSSEVGVAFAWHTQPHRVAQDLFKTELLIGGHAGTDPDLTPRLYNAVLGTRFKIISGYGSTTDIGLAVERGEVFGVGDWSWSSLKRAKRGWLDSGQIRVLMQNGLQKVPELEHLPLAVEFARTDDDKRLLELYLTQKTAARPIMAPPEMPPERVQTLRTAFAALASDSEFLADAAKSGVDIDIMPGERLDRLIQSIAAAPAPITDRLAALLSPAGK